MPLKIEKISNVAYTAALSKKRIKRDSGEYDQVMGVLKTMKPGECFKLSFEGPKQASSFRATLGKRIRDVKIANGNIADFTLFKSGKEIYFRASRIEVNGK